MVANELAQQTLGPAAVKHIRAISWSGDWLQHSQRVGRSASSGQLAELSLMGRFNTCFLSFVLLPTS